MSEHEMTIGFIGNPNCGKTTLFNAYTGANLKVANWPGVTVEKVEGVMKDHDLTIHLVDLPGTYSLTSYTMEETVSRQFILSDEVDVIINVVDASALERNLYLTLQLLELGKPVVLALNMMGIVEKRGILVFWNFSRKRQHDAPGKLGVPLILHGFHDAPEGCPVCISGRRMGRQHDLGTDKFFFLVVEFYFLVVFAEQPFAALVSGPGNSRLSLAALDDGNFEMRTRNRHHPPDDI